MEISNLNSGLNDKFVTKDELNKEVSDMSANIGDLSNLNTNDKNDLVGAINELFQNANNGKELIANAIGEPVSADDTFSAMSSDINGLLSTFKTNMMNNGVAVESSDRFKSLIDKIATMVEEGSSKGIQFTEGVLDTLIINNYLETTEYTYTYEQLGIDFTPTIMFASVGNVVVNNVINKSISAQQGTSYWVSMPVCDNSKFAVSVKFDIYGIQTFEMKYWAIGVGEEDTTLRDSLASILEEEGVEVTEEDDMTSLISKVDTEFGDKESEISTLESENTSLNNQVSNLSTKANEYDSARTLAYNTLVASGLTPSSNATLGELLAIIGALEFDTQGIRQIACGIMHSVVLKKDGTLWACGYGSYYGGSNYNTFTQIASGVRQVSCGVYHTVILKGDGTVWSTGTNSDGQLGVGDTTNRSSFTKLTTNVDDVKEIYCGPYNTFVIKNSGQLCGCGQNCCGEIGVGHTNAVTVLTNAPGMNDIKQVSCGMHHSVAVSSGGDILYACGDNDEGQLGLGSSANASNTTFTWVQTNSTDVAQIACGNYHTVVLKEDGTVYACGDNSSGQLGLNSTTAKNTLTKLSTNATSITAITCGGDNTFAVKSGALYACGENSYGELGIGSTTAQKTLKACTNGSNISQVVCSSYHTIILKTDGKLYVCGADDCKIYNNTSSSESTTFVQITNM